jgi:hypothetical protein
MESSASEEQQTRESEIAIYVGTMIDDAMEEMHYWKVPGGGPTWGEFRDAMMAKLFDVQRVMTVQEMHSEFVSRNCL